MDIRTGEILALEAVKKLPETEQKFYVGVTRENLDQIPAQFRDKALKAIKKRERRAAKRQQER